MRDYKPRPRSKKRRARTTGRGRAFLWGLLLGLIAGVGGYHLYDSATGQSGPDWLALTANQPPRVVGTHKPGEHDRATPVVKAEEAPTPPKFEFFTILPEMETAVPEPDTTPTESDGRGPQHTYILQAGSFRRHSDAEQMKALLALGGNVAQVAKVTIDGQTWYRVRLGPFSSRRAMDQVRNQLARQQIHALALQLK